MDAYGFHQTLHHIKQRVSEMSSRYPQTPIHRSHNAITTPTYSQETSVSQQLRHMNDQIAELYRMDGNGIFLRHEQQRDIDELSKQVQHLQQLMPIRSLNQLHELPDALPQPTYIPLPHPLNVAPSQQFPTVVDRFSEQMQDLKAHLARIEMAMSSNRNGHQWPESSIMPVQTKCLLPEQMALHWASPTTRHAAPGFPQGATSGQHQSTLAEDVRTMNSRISDLEQTVFKLEDRLDDALYPANKFTPPASISSRQDGIPEECLQTTTSTQLQPQAQPYKSSLDPAFRQFHDGKSVNASQTDGLFGNHLHTLPDPIRNYMNAADSEMMKLREKNELLQRYAEQAKAENAVALATIAEQRKSAAVAMCYAWNGENDHPTKSFERTAHGQEHRSRGGVAYRDQEIASLDELLRIAQEKLAANEEDIRQLTDDKAGIEQALSDRTKAMDQMRTTIKIQEGEIYGYKAAVDHADEKFEAAEAWGQSAEQRLKDCQNTKNEEVNHLVSRRDEQIRQLQQFCEQKDAVVYKQGQIVARGAQLMGEKDEEIETLSRRLRAAEDEAAHERHQRARLARVLTSRDHALAAHRDAQAEVRRVCEIPMLSRREHIEDRWSEVLGRLDRIGKVIEASRQYEQSEEADANVPVRPGYRRILVRGDQSPRSAQQPSPFQANTHATTSWTPRAIEGDRRLSHEVRRASIWEEEARKQERPSATRSRDGQRRIAKPDERTSHYPRREGHVRHHSQARNDISRHESVSPRRNHGVKVNQYENTNALSILANEQNLETHSDTQRGSSPAHHRQPSDGDLWWPPLPVKSAVAHKARSIADLRPVPQNDQDRRGSLASRRSVQELPRKQLQAYVETEAESGGEFGGEV